ncbi:hypothetical protein BG006_002616 [Podila minutissima]|uniref:Uncharacterized protein n=1 Tax=Podila minutissima TaxID=64525 RepID=A0A9P5VGN1_9FUNG|nr:hypothetical protein BG006_002616 [Podila minutissima]
MKINNQLNTILGSLCPLRMSFGKFIVACLTLKDKCIIHWMKNFYKNEGPAELMNIWQVQVHKENDIQLMLRAAMDLIVKHCTIELIDALEDPKICLSAKLVTSGAANSFKLKTKANYLQMVMGLYLFSKGAPCQLMGVLCKAGMSVSHQMVLQGIHSLTMEAKAEAKNAATTKSWYLIHNNINMAFHKYDQQLDNQDLFKSGTAATLVIQEEFNDLGYKPGLINLQLSDLLLNKDNKQHLQSVI